MPNVDLHKEQMLEPSQWVLAAEGLLATAALLEPQASRYWQTNAPHNNTSENCLKTQLMLAGYALENLLKALIVQDQRKSLDEEITTKKRLPAILKSHNLINLAQDAMLHITDEHTMSLLARLTRHSVWAGRYPVPIQADDLPADDLFKIARPGLVCVSAYVKQDWENFQILFQRAKKIMKDRKDAPTRTPAVRDARVRRAPGKA